MNFYNDAKNNKYSEYFGEFLELANQTMDTYINQHKPFDAYLIAGKAIYNFEKVFRNLFDKEGKLDEFANNYNKRINFFVSLFENLTDFSNQNDAVLYFNEFYLASERENKTYELKAKVEPYQIKHSVRTVDLLVHLVFGCKCIKELRDELLEDYKKLAYCVPWLEASENVLGRYGDFIRAASRSVSEYMYPKQFLKPGEEDRYDVLPQIIFSRMAFESYCKLIFISNDISFTKKPRYEVIEINKDNVDTPLTNIHEIREQLVAHNLLDELFEIELSQATERGNRTTHNLASTFLLGVVHSMEVVKICYNSLKKNK